MNHTENLPAVIPAARPPALRAKSSNKMAFSIAALRKALADPNVAATLIDVRQPGLIMRRSASGRWDFRFEKKVGSKLFRKTLEQWTERANIEQLRDSVRDLIQTAAAGEWAAGGADEVKLNATTWVDALGLHCELAKVRPATLKLYRVAVDTFSGKMPKALSELDGPGFRAAFKKVVKAGVSEFTASTYARALSAIWTSWAWSFDEKRRPAINPIKSGLATGPKRSASVTPPPRTGRLTQDQVGPFIKAADAQRQLLEPVKRSHYAAAQFVALTGLRAKEAFELRWSEVKGSWLEIAAERMKGGKQFRKPLGKRALAILAQQRALGGEFVFPSWRGKGPITTVAAAMAKLNAAAGSAVRVHDLRRTYISTAKVTGVSDSIIKKLVAHSHSGDVTERHYVVGVDDLLLTAAQQVEDALAGGVAWLLRLHQMPQVIGWPRC